MSITNIVLISIIALLLIYCGKLKLRQKSDHEKALFLESQQLQVSNNDIMEYMRDISSQFIPYMEDKGIDFSIKCTPETMMGWIDTEKTDKIVLLLLSEMGKHAVKEGKIAIDVDTNPSYDHINFRVRDNGPKLTNMCLLMVHQLVYMHQGTINTSYYEGQGNTIVIVLPIKKDAFQLANTSGATSTAFHIPSNVELHVPTIELPEGYKEGENPLDAIIQQAYVSADQEYLKRATRCIHEHMSDSDYDREAFAADMGSSVSTLYNKIRALTGKNITNFVRDIRIKKACQLAKANPDLRVSDIAYQVGFKDPKYFATSFKRVMGVQPKEYFLKVREMK